MVVDAALHDAEQGVAVALGEGVLAALGPAHRHFHGIARLLFGGGEWGAFVEHHGDGAAQQVLDFDGALGRQLVFRAVDVGLEGDALLGHLAQLAERHHLKPTRIGEDGAAPVHELMQATEARDALGAGPQHQVIGIAKNDIRARGLHVFRVHGLHGGGRADGHEGRRADGAVGGVQRAGAGLAVPRVDGEGNAHAARSSRLVSP